MTTNAAPSDGAIRDAGNASSQRLPAMLRILLVEDNAEHADWVKYLISQGFGEECEVIWRSGLGAAISALESAGPDVVILDLGLPDMSGHKSQLVFNSLAPRLPVVILTSDDRKVTRELAALSGAAAYLIKSDATPKVLASTIINAIEKGPRNTRNGSAAFEFLY